MKDCNLYLDDIRSPIDSFHTTKDPIYIKLHWNIVRSYEEFVNFVKKNKYISIISLDHDLSDEHYEYGDIEYRQYKEKTGYECAIWYCDYFINNISDNISDFPKIYIHSQNTVGVENISMYIQNFKKNILK